VALLSATACKKDSQTYCFECTEYEVVEQMNVVIDATEIQSNIFCGLKESEIRNFEHNMLVYQDSFSSIYRVQTCEKTDRPNGQ
jgi:hypothetical protein